MACSNKYVRTYERYESTNYEQLIEPYKSHSFGRRELKGSAEEAKEGLGFVEPKILKDASFLKLPSI